MRCRRLLWGRQTQLRPSFQLKSYPRCPVSTGWPDLRPISRVESLPTPVGAVGRWLVQHERRWVSRGYSRGCTAEIWDNSSLGSEWLFRLRDRNYQCSSPDLWNFKLAHAGSKELAKPRFESWPGVEYKLQEDGIQSRTLFWLQASEGSKLFRYCDPQVLESSAGRTAPCWWTWWTRGRQSCVPRSSRVAGQ